MKKRLILFISLLTFTILFTSGVFANSIVEITNSYEYEFKETVEIINDSNKLVEGIYSTLKLEKADDSPYQRGSYVNFIMDTNGIETIEKSSINDEKQIYSLMEFSLKPNEKICYTITRNFIVGDFTYNFDDNIASEAVAFTEEQKESLKDYLKNETNIESKNKEIVSFTYDLTKDEPLILRKAKLIHDYIVQNIEYSYENSHVGAYKAFKQKSGVCEDMSQLFVAMCRSIGIPSRVVYGYALDVQGSLNEAYDILNIPGHAWAEFYIPDYGWVFVDPTFDSYDNANSNTVKYFGKDELGGHIVFGYDSLQAGVGILNGGDSIKTVNTFTVTKKIDPIKAVNELFEKAEKDLDKYTMKLLKEKIDKIKNEDVKNLFLERYDDLNFLYSIKNIKLNQSSINEKFKEINKNTNTELKQKGLELLNHAQYKLNISTLKKITSKHCNFRFAYEEPEILKEQSDIRFTFNNNMQHINIDCSQLLKISYTEDENIITISFEKSDQIVLLRLDTQLRRVVGVNYSPLKL